MPIISSATQKLIKDIKKLDKAETLPGSRIHVDVIASKVAAFYERIRKVVDYQEEHLFRKNALERMLRRRLVMQENQKADIAQPVIEELIRAGYLPNDTILESTILDIQIIIKKYLYFLKYISDLKLAPAQQEDIFKWLISLSSCEIEEKLAPPEKDQALSEYMYQTVEPKIILRQIDLHDDERKALIFIAVQKALLRADNSLLHYRLLKYHFPLWLDSTNITFLEAMAPRLLPLRAALAQEINNPLGSKFYNICNQYNTPYLVLGDALVNDPDLLHKTPEEIENGIDDAYQERYKLSKKKLKRAAIYSTLSIFITKVLFAFVVELNLDKLLSSEISYFTLGINIIFPPLLMFLIVSSIKPPRAENAQKVVVETIKIIYQTERKDEYEIKENGEKSGALKGFIELVYWVLFLIVFWLIIWGLLKINFSLPSIIIFLMFISLISFAGLKIRQRSKELSVEKIKESAWTFFIDLFALPLVRVGRWLSGQWTKFNIIVVIFNFILEVPFMTFVEFLEKWRHFLKEKKEEIQ